MTWSELVLMTAASPVPWVLVSFLLPPCFFSSLTSYPSPGGPGFQVWGRVQIHVEVPRPPPFLHVRASGLFPESTEALLSYLPILAQG